VRRAIVRVAPYVFVVLGVAAALAAVGRHGSEVTATLRHLGLLAACASFVAAIGGTFLVDMMWRQVLRGLDAPVPFRATSRVFFVSQLGKYLPGSVWPVLAQMEYGRRTGTPRPVMLAANVMTLALNLVAGLIVAVVVMPFASTDAVRRYWWVFAALPVLLALLHPRVLPAMLNVVLRRLHRAELEGMLSWTSIAKVLGWALGSWLLFGLHLYLLVAGSGVHGWHAAAASFGGFALAIVAGILFIPAPAGAGVRDAVLIASLAASMAAGSALAIGLVSRVMLIVVDLTLAGAFGVGRGSVVVESVDKGS
jgi:uncharacterized membrane protein YbhN (UPF0104 family)